MIGTVIALAGLSNILNPYADYATLYFDLPGKRTNWLTQGEFLPPTKESENTRFPDGTLISITPNQDRAITVTIHNQTTKTHTIATNGGPTVWLEAIQDGHWRPIQYIGMKCGNGAAIVEFEPGSFSTAIHTFAPGNYKTKIRAAFSIIGDNKTYSNAIDFTINPLSFTPKPDPNYITTINTDHGVPFLHCEEKPIKP